MANVTSYGLVEMAIDKDDHAAIRQGVNQHLQELKEKGWLTALLVYAARQNRVDIVALLCELGADVNASVTPDMPEGVIYRAASEGATDVVKWLLEHGARVNQQVDGKTRCFAISGAIMYGHLDVVKLLVEPGGADFNAVWGEKNALSFAIEWGKPEIEKYLRSKGAVELAPPKGAAGGKGAGKARRR